ncbi:unnamed protein product, partial [Hymenolepis diminuta]
RQIVPCTYAALDISPHCFGHLVLSPIHNDWIRQRVVQAAAEFVFYAQFLIGGNCKSPSDLVWQLSSMKPWNYLSDCTLKAMLVSTFSPLIQPYLTGYLLNLTCYQVAHVGDIIFDLFSQKSDRLEIKNRNSNMHFVIDTGCTYSVIPPELIDMKIRKPTRWVRTSKGRDINKYGEKDFTLDLGFETALQWNFIIADITEPVIGADFLTHYDIQVDLKRKKLVKNPTPDNHTNVGNGRTRSRVNHCLYLTDRNSGLKFLIDSGAHRSQVPRKSGEMLAPLPFCRYTKANGSPIIEYCYKKLTVDLGLREDFSWHFIITDNDIPIIGADFLSYFGLCIDLRKRKLVQC